MPTPPVIAGLVMGVVLGAGLLCLGAYTVHRYMNWRCQELVDLFQRNTVRVVKIEDLEPGSKTQEKGMDQKKGRIAAAVERTSGRRQRQRVSNLVQDMKGLRGGHDYDGLENDQTWTDERQIQPYIPTPARVYAQAATHPPALQWTQPSATYSQLWHAPAIFQQPAPQGKYYAYIPPHPYMAKAFFQPPSGRPGPHTGFIYQLEPQQAHDQAAQQAGRKPGLGLESTGKVLEDLQPVSFEGDSIVVVDDYDFLVEGVTHQKGKKKRREDKKHRQAEHRESFSTQLGTCSSIDSLTSTADIPRDYIPGTAPHHARLPSPSCSHDREHTRRPARAAGGGNMYARQSHRRGKRQVRKGAGDRRMASRWRSNVGSRRQTGNEFLGVSRQSYPDIHERHLRPWLTTVGRGDFSKRRRIRERSGFDQWLRSSEVRGSL